MTVNSSLFAHFLRHYNKERKETHEVPFFIGFAATGKAWFFLHINQHPTI